ncbi:MAG: membrane protein insertion efficiency factor YidD [Ruminococcaceae bacterium]|nr:membrane protein insertion efficiency factor YidD [Oscillospiraceae bacterium]
MRHVMIWLVGLYRKFISPLKPPCCRFTPTCSAYAIEAYRKRGFFVGTILTVWRILRCNPFSKGGYDPVPDKGFRNKNICRENDCQEHTDTTNEEKDK